MTPVFALLPLLRQGIGNQYFARRVALRNSWMPNTEDGLQQLQAQTGVVVRFVMGFSLIEEENNQLAEEEKTFGKMIRLDVREKYHNLVLKMRRYLQKMLELYDFAFALKVDDDVYHNPHRLSHAAQEWKAGGADYVGCFRREGAIQRNIMNVKHFEPNAPMLGKTYFSYTTGATYAVSQHAAALVSSIPDGQLRYFGCGDDCTMGAWMLAYNVTWYQENRLCTGRCQNDTVTIRLGNDLNGLRAHLGRLHSDPLCSGHNKPDPALFVEPDPANPDAPKGLVGMFSNTNCYQLPSTNDTNFEACFNHEKYKIAAARNASAS
jgi:galactosylxylosylprotein 3-beta-galactosyltransferase